MRGLLYGIQPPRVPQPDTDNPLVAALARTPMDLVEMPDPDFLLPDWVITKPRLTGVCGSDSKQVFMDFGEMNMDNPMRDFSSMPKCSGTRSSPTWWHSGPKRKVSKSATGWCSTRGCRACRAA